MNSLETKVLLSLVTQNEQLVALVRRLTEELRHARSTVRPGAGTISISPSAGITRIPYDPAPGDADGQDRAVRPDLGGLDLPGDGEVWDRGAPGRAAAAGGDVHCDLVPGGPQPDGDARDRDADDPGAGVRLCAPGGPAADPGAGDRGGDTVAPGGDGAGDGDGRVGAGDAQPRADCRYWDCSCNIGGDGRLCRTCITYEPAASGAPVETRRCSRCGRELPLTAFRVRSRVCDDCRAGTVPPAATRVCADCGQEKPLAEFGRKAGRENPGGRRPFCRDCGKERRAAGVRRHRAAQAAAAAAPPPVAPHKQCTRCDKSKPLDDFGPYDGTIDQHDFLCGDCRALATAEREQRATSGARGGATRAAMRTAAQRR